MMIIIESPEEDGMDVLHCDMLSLRKRGAFRGAQACKMTGRARHAHCLIGINCCTQRDSKYRYLFIHILENYKYAC